MAEETLLDADQDAVMRAARLVLKAPLQDAIGVFAQQVSAAFSLDAKGQISWRHGEDHFAIAQLTKSTTLLQPKIKLLHNDLLDEAQNKTVMTRLEMWFEEQLAKNLAPLVALRDAEIKGTGKGIAFQIYEQGGLLLRSDVSELLAALEKEERPALNKLGVKLGAYYIYQRDILKPAALHLKAVLWRLFNGVKADDTPLPQAGNVSMACPENGERAFYAKMGFPVFGKTCVRVDMVERLNSAVFDGAVAGKYKFDPALASTVGVSVETVQAILSELGFRYEEETTGTGEGETPVTTRHYLMRKRPIALRESNPKPTADKAPQNAEKPNRNSDKAKKDFKPKPQQRAESEALKSKAITGYNAFAELAALKNK